MRIAVIGTGYVGLVSCALFAELNHQVIGLDVDKDKISKLKKGQVTIYEPGLESLFQKHLNSGKLTFTTDYKKAIKDIEVAFICVGTPPKKDGSYDSKYVYASAESIAKNLKKYAVIVIKSWNSSSNRGDRTMAKWAFLYNSFFSFRLAIFFQ